jgi:type VI secretion system protein ImpH
MAGASGQKSVAIAEIPDSASDYADASWEGKELLERLEREPWPFGFFQAVRILQLLAPGREAVGRFAKPANEAVRFGAHTGMAFPASEIQSVERERGQLPRMRVNIMGLTGPLGVMPLAYTALLRERQRTRDYTARDFLDIFHHRLLSLFYQAWEKYRFGISFERGERDRLSHHLADLIGLGTAGLENRQNVPDAALLFYTGLLAMHTRPAVALEQLLNDYFGVPAEVEQFVGAWRPIDRSHQCCLGEENRSSEQLGMGAFAGAAIWDEQSRVRIRLGPLTMGQYSEFLPSGEAHRRLQALVAFYVALEFDIEAELILRRDEVPCCELQAEGGLQLGWTTWVKSDPFQRDPGDTVLELKQAA